MRTTLPFTSSTSPRNLVRSLAISPRNLSLSSRHFLQGPIENGHGSPDLSHGDGQAIHRNMKSIHLPHYPILGFQFIQKRTVHRPYTADDDDNNSSNTDQRIGPLSCSSLLPTALCPVPSVPASSLVTEAIVVASLGGDNNTRLLEFTRRPCYGVTNHVNATVCLNARKSEEGDIA